MKKVFCFLMALIMTVAVFCAVPFTESPFKITAQAASSGTCGTNISWNLDDNGTLTISGTGSMANYYSSSPAPWYSNRSAIKKVVISSGITEIGSYAFYSCTSLTNVSLPETLVNIFSYAFYNCYNLSSLNLPDYLISIGKYAFSDCDKLVSVIIPDTVTLIGEGAFKYCSKLYSVAIGSGTEKIDSYAFNSCSKLTDVYYAGSSSDWSVITLGNYNADLTDARLHCDVPVDQAVAHYGYGVVTTLPSGNSTGISTQTCPCGYTYAKSTTCTGHDYGEVTVLKNPKCTRYGIAQRTCSVCGDTEFVSYNERTVVDSSRYPESDHNYSNNASKTYNFSYSGADKLMLKFSDSTLLESGYDYIYIYNSSGSQIGSYTGSSLTGKTIEVTGSSFSIKLTSDGSVTKYGFSFDEIIAVSTFSEIAPLGHNYSSAWTTDVASTCAVRGTKSHHCSRCISRSDITSLPVDTNAHNYGDVIADQQPTCTQAGTLKKVCSGCGGSVTVSNRQSIVVDSSEYPESAHDYGNYISQTYTFTYDTATSLEVTFSSSTATESGYDYIYLYGSDGSLIGTYDGTELAGQYFEIPGDNFSIKLTSDSSVTRYGFSIDKIVAKKYHPLAAALGHNYSSSWTTDIPATCTTSGSKSHHCTRCDDKKDITTISATGHRYGSWITTTSATCTSSGSRYKVCSACSNTVSETIYALGHSYSTSWTIDTVATCTTTGIKSHHCIRCSARKDVTLVEIDSNNHNYSPYWTTDIEPTCQSTGSKSHHCTRCDQKTDITVINPTAHRFSDWEVLKEATYTSFGQKVSTCDVCHSTEYAVIPKLICSAPKLKKATNASNGIKITWNKVTGAEAYVILRKTGNGSWKKIAENVKGTSYTDKTAKSGKTYKYTVRAKSQGGLSQYNTTGLSIKRLATPKLKNVASAKKGITFKWTKVTGASGYIVYRKTGSGSWKKIATLKGNPKVSYLDKSAKKGVTYKYTVKAYSGSTYGVYNTKGLKIKDKY